MSKYRYITIAGRIAPLSVVMTTEYAAGVHREAALAESAPALLAALEALMNATEAYVGFGVERNLPSAMAAAREAIKAVQS